jgi:hypothetical protein
MKILKSDEDRCKQIISGNKPTKILFSELQTYYDNFVNIKTAYGESKRKVIVYELKRLEQKILSDLNHFRHDINNLVVSNMSGEIWIDDFFEAFYQAVILERNLQKLYTLEEDRSQILIRPANIHIIGLKIIDVFEM